MIRTVQPITKESNYLIAIKQRKMNSHGSGLPPWNFGLKGDGTTIEKGVLVFHPENISIGANVYIGHQTILKGYFKNKLVIGDGCWIGQQCFLHSGGNVTIGKDVGIGPGAKIITSNHNVSMATDLPIIKRPLVFEEVIIGDGCDLGINCVILPGVTLGKCVQVGAGAIVTKSFPDNSIITGIPARFLRKIKDRSNYD
jgi:acetyltransferase-like isoleucine patch superfamily enzyme